MVVNIPAQGLIGFLDEKRYLNAYERPVVAGGKAATVSAKRQSVEKLLGLANPQNFYYGAVAIGGTGCRFYGEFSIVLKPSAISRSTRVFDRNSYDLLRPPLSDAPNPAAVVRALRGKWAADVVDMVALKVLPQLGSVHRSLTVGKVSELTLDDEDFIEVQKAGTFRPQDVQEVRVAASEMAKREALRHRRPTAQPLNATELTWCARFAQVERNLADAGIDLNVVTGHHRGGRWS